LNQQVSANQPKSQKRQCCGKCSDSGSTCDAHTGRGFDQVLNMGFGLPGNRSLGSRRIECGGLECKRGDITSTIEDRSSRRVRFLGLNGELSEHT